MYKLVVLSALCALAVAKPSGIIAPAAVAAAPVAYAAPAVAHAYAAPVAYAAPAVAAAPVAYAAPAVAAAPVAYAAPAVAAAPVAISKTVHYASQPVVTGYTSQILKPNLGAIATPLHTVTQQRVLAPARAVQTITPQITQVHPELHVQKVPVDVPVPHPVVSEVEVRHVAPVVHAAPAPVAVAAPAVAAVAAPAVVDARFARVW